MRGGVLLPLVRGALLDVPEPSARPGWVVLEVSGAGICGTDVHIVNDEHPYWPPVTLGHDAWLKGTDANETAIVSTA